MGFVQCMIDVIVLVAILCMVIRWVLGRRDDTLAGLCHYKFDQFTNDELAKLGRALSDFIRFEKDSEYMKPWRTLYDELQSEVAWRVRCGRYDLGTALSA